MADPFIILRVRRGDEVDLPTLAIGELGWCDDSKKLFVGATGGNQFIGTYNALTPANWTGSAPTTNKEALDRIAAAVAGLLGGTIP